MVEKLTALDQDYVDAPIIVKPCCLDKATQSLMKLIFDQDMFKSAMQSMEIGQWALPLPPSLPLSLYIMTSHSIPDTKKMPLGKLSKGQIARGFEALEAIEDALSSGASRARLAKLSSAFYTIIPHSFGRNVPPVIADSDHLQKKFDMLLVRHALCVNCVFTVSWLRVSCVIAGTG